MPADLFVPDDLTLRLFLLGRLSGPESERVERYLETHPEAARTLHALSGDDSFTSALRDQPLADEADPEVNKVMTWLERLLPELGERTTTRNDAGDSLPDHSDSGEVTEVALTFLAPAQGPDELGRLGGYRVLRVLGIGGMGMVLEAEDPKLGRHVAIKVMRPRVAVSPKAVKRFLQEARAAAAVEHDHIIPIWYIGEDNGVPYIVMPFLKGESLNLRLKKLDRLPAAEVIRIGIETAEGLAAAHDKGLVHRDIKPANLWLEGPRSRVKILDFGLARLTTENGQLTQSGAIVGTPAYMAPEQARGQAVDARGDLFSLGGVLYRAATGRNPFQGSDTMSMLMSLATDTPAHPRTLNADLPPTLADVIVRLLQKEPAKRPQSARELIALLAPPTVEALPDSGERRAEFAFDDDATQVEVPRATPAEAEVRRDWRSRGRGLTKAGIALALLAFIGVTVVTYKLVFETKDGTLIVEVSDPDVETRFKNGEVQVLDADGKVKYSLKPGELNKKVTPGEYGVRVVGADGVELNTPEFTMKKGGQVTLRVTARPTVVAKKEPPPANPKPINLLALVDPKRDRVHGRWATVDGKLVGGGGTPVNPIQERLQIPYAPPAEYDLTMRVERTAIAAGGKPVAQRAFVITFAGPAQFQLLLDFDDHSGKVFNGLQLLGDRVFSDNETTFEADLFGETKGPVRIDCEVRRDRVNVKVGGKGRIEWKGDVSQLRLHEPFWTVPDKTRLGLGVQNAEYRIHEWTVTPVDADASADRLAAAYVLSVGGSIRLNSEERSIGKVGDLPAGAFRLTGVDLHECTRTTDAGLACLRHCPRLEFLDLRFTGITEAGLAHLPKLTELRVLFLANTKVKDADLERFRDCRKLAELALDNTEVGDAGLACFKECTSLTFVALNGSRVTDTGLVHLRDCNRLLHLGLQNTRVSGPGLANFKNCAGLIHLDLRNTAIADGDLAPFQGCVELRNLYLNGTGVSDAGLAHFKNCQKLVHIAIEKTKVTVARVEELRKAMPACRIDWDAGTVGQAPASNSTFFNGKDLTGWSNGSKLWKVVDGAVTVSQRPDGHWSKMTHTDRRYRDFELSFKMRAKGGGAGVVFRGKVTVHREVPYQTTTEGLYWHLHDGLTRESLGRGFAAAGAGKPRPDLKKDDFNDVTIRCVGQRVTVTVNGTTGVDEDVPGVAPDGVIGLLLAPNGEEVAFKDLRLVDLGPKAKADPDRLAAEWVLAAGGKVRVNGGPAEEADRAKLPDGPFQLTAVLLAGSAKVTDAGLAALKGCTGLVAVGLEDTTVGDAGLEPLAGSKALTHLYVQGSRVGDAGLAMLKECPNLLALGLGKTPITDAAVSTLSTFNKLQFVDVSGTKMSKSGLANLAMALPLCKIVSDHGTIEAGREVPDFFNGKDLTGWVEPDTKLWAVKGGALVATTRKALYRTRVVYTTRSYRDFQLSFEVRRKGGHAAVNFRGVPTPVSGDLTGGQWVLRAGGETLRVGTEDGVERDPEKRSNVKVDDFNTGVIRAVGRRVTVTLNGKVGYDKELADLPDVGAIGFGLGGPAEEVTFRNLRLVDLSPIAVEKK